MKGDPRIPNPGPKKILPRAPAKNHFTTTMQQCTTGNDIHKKVLGTDVTLPLGELLAVCPHIEKTLSNDTQLRMGPITHVNGVDGDEEMAEAFANIAPSSQMADEFTYLPEFPEKEQIRI